MGDYIIRFFIGKGGVGKTTIAAAYSIMMADKGKKTYIISLDPAHNLGDVFDTRLSDKPRKIMENLWGIEVDYDEMIRKHLSELTGKIKDIYGYLKIFNLDKYVDVLKHSPGIEEQASLEKIIEIVKSFGEKGKADVIVFDTPPTGLMLRIMALPTISLIWIDKLLDLRLAILERRKTIEKITGEEMKAVIAGRELKIASSAEEDPIYRELVSLRETYTWINNILIDESRTGVVLVINPEILPVLEAHRAYEFLKRLSVPVNYVVVNRVLEKISASGSLKARLAEQERAIKRIIELFPRIPHYIVPYMAREPRGLKGLREITKHIAGMS